jgi:hypothetical protein
MTTSYLGAINGKLHYVVVRDGTQINVTHENTTFDYAQQVLNNERDEVLLAYFTPFEIPMERERSGRLA